MDLILPAWGPKWGGVGVVFLASLSRFLNFYLCLSLSFPLMKLSIFQIVRFSWFPQILSSYFLPLSSLTGLCLPLSA